MEGAIVSHRPYSKAHGPPLAFLILNEIAMPRVLDFVFDPIPPKRILRA
jgi:hypothetical protein